MVKQCPQTLLGGVNPGGCTVSMINHQAQVMIGSNGNVKVEKKNDLNSQ